MGKVIPMGDKAASAEVRREARLRAFLVFECLPVLAPKAGMPERRRLADEILSMCAGYERRVRMTPEALLELIQRNAVCVLDQQHKCPLMLFTQVMAWELNCYFGVGNDEDRGFRRSRDIPAARPLRPGHNKEE
ncbi:MAG: hypothetical protein WA765_12115 [Candidatus Acidiferrum sp.]